jgi:hypothetical protein
MVTSKPQIVEYSVSTLRPFAGTLGGDVCDVLPCKVEISAQFMNGKDALAWERGVRQELEALASASPAPTHTHDCNITGQEIYDRLVRYLRIVGKL